MLNAEETRAAAESAAVAQAVKRMPEQASATVNQQLATQNAKMIDPPGEAGGHGSSDSSTGEEHKRDGRHAAQEQAANNEKDQESKRQRSQRRGVRERRSSGGQANRPEEKRKAGGRPGQQVFCQSCGQKLPPRHIDPISHQTKNCGGCRDDK